MVGKTKLTADQRKYAIMAFAAGCTPKAVYFDLVPAGRRHHVLCYQDAPA
jgi:hypothetical protein